MHNLVFIRENPEAFDIAMKKRGEESKSKLIISLDSDNRAKINSLNKLQEKRNNIAKEIGIAKKEKNDALFLTLKAEAGKIREEIKQLEKEQKQCEKDLNDILVNLPNIPLDDVVVGNDENDNVEISKFNYNKREMEGVEHFDVKASKKWMDFKVAAKISGARFTFLFNDLAKLERSIANFMLDQHVKEFGFNEVSTPVLVNEQAAFNTGQLPKFSEDLFFTKDGRVLIPTAEVSLTNIVADEALSVDELPLRYCALTQCFRSEAGAAGRDTHGLLRQHQFSKVELVIISSAEESVNEHEYMTKASENILEKLELPYRKMLLCTKDMGFSAAKTYDLEVWLPGQKNFREIASISNCGDFQARRMNAKYVDQDNNRNFVHTLNGSGLAVGRTLIAIIENYQRKDGRIDVPKILQPYMEKEIIG